ncbi:Lrp/AsnC family transcriptional regulator [uncultured Flavobacterium sp.]|uniref:Lrp/AsnC family transcriptional regulator n=1 Tax=uncultured Flavobacterium sp. TaxID=165435 RepID=UPI0030CA5458
MSALDDELDYQILKLLQKDGRMSFTEISKEINVAVSTIRHRYINLVEDGTLQIIGRVDPNKIGFNAYASILISVRPKSRMNSILEDLEKLPEISFLALVSGDFDIEANVMCRDMEHLNELLVDKIHTMDGIFDTKTNMYMKIYKFAQPDLELAKLSSK